MTYKFALLPLSDVKLLFSEKICLLQAKESDCYGRTSLVLSFKWTWQNNDRPELNRFSSGPENEQMLLLGYTKIWSSFSFPSWWSKRLYSVHENEPFQKAFKRIYYKTLHIYTLVYTQIYTNSNCKVYWLFCP